MSAASTGLPLRCASPCAADEAAPAAAPQPTITSSVAGDRGRAADHLVVELFWRQCLVTGQDAAGARVEVQVPRASRRRSPAGTTPPLPVRPRPGHRQGRQGRQVEPRRRRHRSVKITEQLTQLLVMAARHQLAPAAHHQAQAGVARCGRCPSARLPWAARRRGFD